MLAIAVGVGGGSLLTSAVGPGATAGPGASPSPSGDTGHGSASPVAPTPTVEPTPSPSPTPEPTPVLVPAALTGLLVTESAARQHPIAVMVDDHRDARPQAGFNAAAQVWQAPAEGGIPRYMLIFQDALPTSVGPIRSARQYYIEWAAEWTAMYVHIGGSPQAMATLRAKGGGQLVYNADGFRFDGTHMFRVEERRAPHNLFSDADNLRAMARALDAPDEPLEAVWSFTRPIPIEARPAGTTITIHYPYETIRFAYDPVSNTYRRYIDGSAEAQIDAADGRPVAPTNVVILRMRFGPLADGNPSKHRLEAQDVGSGEAIISTNGRVVVGTWEKKAIDAPTRLFGGDGEPVILTAGQTFVQVLALSYPYEVVEGTLSPTGIGLQ